MNLKKNVSLVVLGATLVLSGGLSVYAGTTWQSDSVVLPGFNGSVLTNKQQKKEGPGTAGLQMGATGGTQIDARTYGKTNGAWVRDVIGGSTRELPAPQAIGSLLNLQFSSNITTTSPQTLVYNWRSN